MPAPAFRHAAPRRATASGAGLRARSFAVKSSAVAGKFPLVGMASPAAEATGMAWWQQRTVVEAVNLVLPPAGLAMMAASPAYTRRELTVRAGITAFCLVALTAYGPALRDTYEAQLKQLKAQAEPTAVVVAAAPKP